MAASLRPRVFLDVSIGESPAGRLVIELFTDKTPRTCENFRALCNGDDPSLTYRLSPFHRIIDEFMIQGGDVTKGDGTGGNSIYGGEFDDENLSWRELDAAGLVCMANRGKGTNSSGPCPGMLANDIRMSRFFITLDPCPHLNGKHTIFGHVLKGHDTLSALAKVPVDRDDKPLQPVLVARCGELIPSNSVRPVRPSSAASLERGRRRNSVIHSASPSPSHSRSPQPPPVQKEKRKRRQSDNIIDETLRGRIRARSNSLSSIHSVARSTAKSSGSRGAVARGGAHKREPSPSRGVNNNNADKERSTSGDTYERRRRRSLPNQYDDRKREDGGEEKEAGRDSDRRHRPKNEYRGRGDDRRDGRRDDRYTPRSRDQDQDRTRERDGYRRGGRDGYRGGDRGFGAQSYRPPPRDGRLDGGRLGADPYGGSSGDGDEDSAIKFKGRGSMKFREPDRRW
ncbi:hypothetical protein MBLNU459_g6294t1 [Dothideomycetes sp. NU459]